MLSSQFEHLRISNTGLKWMMMKRKGELLLLFFPSFVFALAWLTRPRLTRPCLTCPCSPHSPWTCSPLPSLTPLASLTLALAHPDHSQLLVPLGSGWMTAPVDPKSHSIQPPGRCTSENQIGFGALFEKKITFHFWFWRLLLDFWNSDLFTLVGYNFMRKNCKIKNKMTVGKKISRAP